MSAGFFCQLALLGQQLQRQGFLLLLQCIGQIRLLAGSAVLFGRQGPEPCLLFLEKLGCLTLKITDPLVGFGQQFLDPAAVLLGQVLLLGNRRGLIEQTTDGLLTLLNAGSRDVTAPA